MAMEPKLMFLAQPTPGPPVVSEYYGKKRRENASIRENETMFHFALFCPTPRGLLRIFGGSGEQISIFLIGI